MNNLLKEPEATIPLRTASLLTLAQLNLVKERWDTGINLILQWMDEVETSHSSIVLSCLPLRTFKKLIM